MSKLISRLLGANHRDFHSSVSRLEKLTNQSGTDVRLTAEIITKTRSKIKELGLDPKDTGIEELYLMLLSKVEKNDRLLRKKLSVSDKTTPGAAAKIVAKSCHSLLQRELVVSITPVAIKKILISVPPKKTLRALKFRSVEAVTKRQSALTLYALAKSLEDKSWHSQIYARIKRLNAREVKELPVQVVSLPTTWSTKLSKYKFSKIVQIIPEVGTILVMPSIPVGVKGSILLSEALTLQAAQKLRVESFPYRSRALNVGMENLLPNIARGIVPKLQNIYGMAVDWSAVYRLFADEKLIASTDFDFILGDLDWISTEMRIASVIPDADFWVGTHYLGQINTNLVVSLHLIDVATNLVLNRKTNQSVTIHLQNSLWNEFQLSYLRHDSLKRKIIDQLTLAQEIAI